MGWKTFKERFKIDHIVHINECGNVCIGTGYVPKIVEINPVDGKIVEHWALSDFLRDNYPEIPKATPEDLVNLFNAKDEFSQSLPVYVFENGFINEISCEDYGWPNVTHCGRLMYDNAFFKDRSDCVIRARDNLRSLIELSEERKQYLNEELRNVDSEVEGARKMLEYLDKEESG